MRKRVLLIILTFAILTFALLQLKYAFQMKLLTMVIQTKVEKTVTAIGNSIGGFINKTEASELSSSDNSSSSSSSNSNASNDIPKTNNSAAANNEPKSIKETLEKAKTEKPKTDLTNNDKFTLTEQEIAKLFTPAFQNMRVSYIDKMESLVDKAKAEYLAIPEAERESNKLSLGFKYMELGEEMEKQCDAEFNEALDLLKSQLQKSGSDMTLADTAKLEYEQQKYDLKKILVDKVVK